MVKLNKKKKPKGTQLRTLERREKVQKLLLIDGLNESQIAAKLQFERHTVANDIQSMQEDADFWLNAQTRSGWVIQSKALISDAFKDIDNLQKRITDCEDDKAYAQLQNAITNKRRFIKDFMDDLPLYRKMQSLARWVEEHQPKETLKVRVV